jgi:hypothetical protein
VSNIIFKANAAAAASASAVLQSVKSGCFAQYVKAICKDPASASMQLGL